MNFMTLPVRRSICVCIFTLTLASLLSATNAVPWLREPLSPMSATAGGPAFTLSIYGTNIATNCKVLWNGVKRNAMSCGTTNVLVSVTAADIAVPGTAVIQVENDTPGGGYSNAINFPIGTSKTALTGVNSTAPAANGVAWPAVGDFNNDGKLDVATANASANSVSVFLGNGDGTFQPHADYNVGTTPSYIATGDFNNDGNLDLVVANKGSNTISVLLGNGDGTFQAAINASAGAGPTAVATADFNHDGKLDVVVPNPSANTVSVLLGNGDGTFGSPLTSSTAAYPVHVAVADFDGDGKIDVVAAASNCATPPCGMGSISVLRGKGDGTFPTRHDFQADIGTSFVAVASSVISAESDIIAVNPSVSGGNGSISYFLNKGRGTFATPVSYPTGASSSAVVIGDFNNDNKLDLAVLNSQGAGLTLEFGNGNGTFGGNGITASSFTFSGNTTGLAVGDFNNDGQLDFVSANGSSNDLEILTQQQAPAAVSLSQTSVNFGVQLVEVVSPTTKVTLTNSGGATLSISSITVSPTQFLESNDCPSTLAGGHSCTLSLAFDPTGAIGYGGSVIITDSATTSPQTISLNGAGTFTQYSATSLNFGNVTVGATSSLPITLTNLSDNPINFFTFNIHGTGHAQFSQTNNCGTQLAGRASCTLTVTFAPTFKGTRNATFSVATSGGPRTDIPLTGTGQ